ncbi:hypothetical protein BDV96DRAFT_648716 [Lophiotrema nucula]|uniref:Uncharacterized protein n=1 Tax=Lophiotrema nucula TaxID=690887 RepID=A0A6A5Z2L4_9PLEO|nr:hypothetical protein BDV96DRAFT_648716 [Lophiotrema nucula]
MTNSVSTRIQGRLLEAANDVAVEHALHSHWSIFHLWHYFGAHENAIAPVESVWDETAPFVSCLGLAYLVQRDLKCKLQSDPELVSFQDKVQIMTNVTVADSNRYQYHVIVVFEFDQSCIVVDVGYHPTAIQLTLGETFHMEVSAKFNGILVQSVMRYIKRGGRKLLQTAFSALAFPGAQQENISITDRIKPLPPKKGVNVRMLVNEEPRSIPSIECDGKYIIHSCQCSVDFGKRSVWLQIPNEDWIQRHANSAFRD